jgi:hypothetical protein
MSVLSAAVSVTACHDSPEDPPVAESRIEHFVRELERSEPEDALVVEESQAAEAAAAFEAQEAAETVAREREELREILASELAWVDKRIADLRRSVLAAQGEIRVQKAKDVAAARAFRVKLERARQVLEKAVDDSAWESVKSHIERDVDEDRPAAIPRTYETSEDI